MENASIPQPQHTCKARYALVKHFDLTDLTRENSERYESYASPAVKRLLWERHRLRATILVADQVCEFHIVLLCSRKAVQQEGRQRLLLCVTCWPIRWHHSSCLMRVPAQCRNTLRSARDFPRSRRSGGQDMLGAGVAVAESLTQSSANHGLLSIFVLRGRSVARKKLHECKQETTWRAQRLGMKR